MQVSGYEYDGLDESNDRHIGACVDFGKFLSATRDASRI